MQQYCILACLLVVNITIIHCETIKLKLIDGSTSSEGTVYVKRGSDWGLVCDDNWDINAAKVVCRQLGYVDAVKFTTLNNFQTSKAERIFLDDVKCRGHEANLGSCMHREWMISNCNSDEAAGVVCQNYKVLPSAEVHDEKKISLSELLASTNQSSQNSAGQTEERLRIAITNISNSVAGAPYDSGYSQRTRALLERARQLLNGNYEVPAEPQITSAFQQPSILTAQYQAPEVPQPQSYSSALQGLTESLNLNQPAGNIISQPPDGAPQPSLDIAVSRSEMNKVDELINDMKYKSDQPLSPPARPYRVEITGGKRSNEGYVKVTLDNGKTGAICSDNWGIYEAMVVCRQVANQQAERAILKDYFGARSQDKVIYEVNCDGHEKAISDCEYKLADRHGVKCSKPMNVAGVVCTSAKLPDLMPNIWALQTSVFIEQKSLYSLQCAMEERCLSSSAYNSQSSSMFGYSNMFGGFGSGNSRKLLRFSSNIFNNGTADFRPHQHRNSWEWHSCHQHYHSMNSFSHYDILDSHGNRVAEGHKASFCLEDVECNWGARKKYSCRGFADQGISVGCADVYKSDIDCQWVDITDLKPGAYVFKLNVNPQMTVPELSYDNNAAICELSYNGYSAKLTNCALSRG